MIGGDGDDVVDGGTGNDLLVGGHGGGDDVYKGGTGVDTIRYSSAIKTVTINLATGKGTGTDIGNDTLSGVENIIGGQAGDKLTGDTGANRIDGGTGADTVTGLTGDDTYIIDRVGDVTVEKTSDGRDTVIALVSGVSLAGNVENLILQGAATTGTGNSLDNVITGNSKVNTLSGGSGNDILDGGTGTDKLIGGAGNDTYVLGSESDTVTDSSGTDTISSTKSRSLTSSTAIENLTLLGSKDVNGTGNDGKNTITGNSGGNILSGGAGLDTLIGGAGNDILNGSSGKDTFIFDTKLSASTNVDTIVKFSVADDTIFLENAVFKTLTVEGKLTPTAFASNSTGVAEDAKGRIIYEKDTGELYYDADGNGSSKAIFFAQLDVNLAITDKDFLII